MGKYLGIPVTIYVPWFMNEYTQDLIRSEGADVKVLSNASYDDSMQVAEDDSKSTGASLVTDVSFGDFKQIPRVRVG